MFDPTKLEALKQQQEKWNRKVEAKLAKAPERKKDFTTLSEIPLARLYTPAEIPDLDYERDLGYPRGISFHPGGPAHHVPGPLLDDAPVCRLRHAEESNRRYRYLLEQGQTGLSRGLRSPHPDRLRFRPSPVPGRGGQGGRGHRLPARTWKSSLTVSPWTRSAPP